MRVQFPLPALLYHGVIAMAASKAHNLEVGGSSPPPVTKINLYGRDRKIKDDKD